MKILMIRIIAFAGMAMSLTATAEDLRYYTATSSFKNVKVVQGVEIKGHIFSSSSWSGVAQITESNGYKVKVNFSCIGMDQPASSHFDRYVTCDHVSESGNTTSNSEMGCMTENSDGTEMSCTGYLQVKTGDIKGRLALVTEYYKFTKSGGSTTRTGHWIR